MKEAHIVADTTRRAITLGWREEGSLRKFAASIGRPDKFASTLSDMIRAKPGAVTLERENEVRLLLGLDPHPVILTTPCPSCGIVHTAALDCKGTDGQAKWIKKRAKRAPRDLFAMSVEELAAAIENRKVM